MSLQELTSTPVLEILPETTCLDQAERSSRVEMSLQKLTLTRVLEVLPETICLGLVERYVEKLYLPKIYNLSQIFMEIGETEERWSILQELRRTFPDCVDEIFPGWEPPSPFFLGNEIRFREDDRFFIFQISETLNLKRHNDIIRFFEEKEISTQEGITVARV